MPTFGGKLAFTHEKVQSSRKHTEPVGVVGGMITGGEGAGYRTLKGNTEDPGEEACNTFQPCLPHSGTPGNVQITLGSSVPHI